MGFKGSDLMKENIHLYKMNTKGGIIVWIELPSDF